MRWKFEVTRLSLVFSLLFLGTAAGLGASVPVGEPSPAAELPGVSAARPVSQAPPISPPEATGADAPTTAPLPVDLPEVPNLHELMELMKGAFRDASNKDPRKARAGAAKVATYTLASLHPRLRIDDPRFDKLAIEAYLANQAYLKTLEESAGDRRQLSRALRDVNNACYQCHKVFRAEEKESRAPAGSSGSRPAAALRESTP
ncbi:MAG: hypothetical protein PWP23_99 [Candidatus Sumerlaeota bacterium]|nr:hypothetical protein [Candidatus Sumerlaeota bacterium]